MPLPWILGGLAVAAVTAYAASDDSEEREREERKAQRREDRRIEQENEAAAQSARRLAAEKQQQKAEYVTKEKLRKSKELSSIFLKKYYPKNYSSLTARVNKQTSVHQIKTEMNRIINTQKFDDLDKLLLEIAIPKSTIRLVDSATIEIQRLRDSMQ